MFKIGEEEEHRQMGKISSNDVHSREAKISGGARSSLFYFFFSLSQSVLEGGDGKETREREGGMLSFTRRLSSSFLRSFRAWEEGFIAREALWRGGSNESWRGKRNDRIYIYIYATSRQIFKDYLWNCAFVTRWHFIRLMIEPLKVNCNFLQS